MTILRLFAICLVLAAPILPGAEPVGDLGLPERWAFSGQTAFTAEELAQALADDAEVVATAHPRAPRAGLLRAIEERLEAGYRAHGFPRPQVRALAGDGRLVITVAEGVALTAGEVVIEGAQALAAAELRSWLEAPPEAGLAVLWGPAIPPCFDTAGQERYLERLRHAYGVRGHLAARLAAETAAGHDGRALLRVRVLDEGRPATVAALRWHGLDEAAGAACARAMGWSVGMPAVAGLPQRMQRQLVASGRYRTQQVSWAGDPADGRLDITVLPSRQVPGFPAALPPEGEVLLRAGNWIAQVLERGGADLVATADEPTRGLSVRLVVGLPDRGLLLVARSATGFTAAGLADGHLLVAGSASGRGVRVPLDGGARLSLVLNAHATANLPPVGDDGAVPPQDGREVSFLFHLSPPGSSTASILRASLEPNQLLNLAFTPGVRRVLEHGRLVVGGDDAQAAFAAEDGRLLVLQGRTATGAALACRFVAGGFDDELRRLEQEGAGLGWIRSSDHPWLEAADLALAEVPMLMRTMDLRFDGGAPSLPRAEAVCKAARRLLAPLRLLPAGPAAPAGTFSIPPAGRETGEPVAAAGARLCWWLSRRLAGHLPPSSWPVTCTRGAGMHLLGCRDLLRADLEALATDPDLGPLGCLVASRLLGLAGHPAAGAFAAIGRSRLDDGSQRREALLLLRPLAPVLAAGLVAAAGEPALLDGLPAEDRPLVEAWLAPWRTPPGDAAELERRLAATVDAWWAAGLRAQVARLLGAPAPAP